MTHKSEDYKISAVKYYLKNKDNIRKTCKITEAPFMLRTTAPEVDRLKLYPSLLFVGRLRVQVRSRNSKT
jgi:hypothetical protein